MGNTQSTEAPRKLAKPQKTPNKLTKPKTNTSTANLLSLSAPSTPSRRNSQVQISSQPPPPLPLTAARSPNTRNSTFSIIEGAVSVLEEVPLKEEPKKRRTSIFRSKSSQKSVRSVKITSIEPEVPEPTPAERWSRSNSMTHELPGDSYFVPNPVETPAPNPRLSFLNRQSYSHQPRLSLVVEQQTPLATPSPVSDEGSKRFSKLWGGNKQESQSSAPPSPLAERPEAEPAIYAPIRRRSLLTPGIATRNSYVEPTSREMLPSQMQAPSTSDQLRRYYHSPRKSAPKPLSDLSLPAPNFADDGPGPRALTPSEQGYGHIGAFQLGSLRITNGAASPTPSDNRSFTMGGEEDLLTTADRKASFESSRSRHTHRRSNTLTVATEIIKPPWIIRAESPLRQEHTAPPELQHLAGKTVASKTSEVNEAKHTAPDRSLSLFDFRTHHSPTKSQELANEYMQDIALSPFSFEESPPRSPELMVSSKHNAMEDDLFAPDSDVTPIEAPLPSSSVDSGYHAGPPIPAKIPISRDLTPKPLAKADSGYSSNVSLRSFKSAAPDVPAKEAPPTPPKESRPRMSSFSYSKSSVASADSDKTIRPRYSLPATSYQEDVPSMPFRQAPPVPVEATITRTATAPTLPRKSAEQRWAAAEVRAQAAAHQRQKGPPTPARPTDSPTGSDSSNSSVNSRRKATKPQPPLQPIFTIQAQRSIGDDLQIPPVSPQAARQLEERVSGFPVASFPNTVEGNLRPSVSKETLGTILSVGSVEQREEHKPILERYHSTLPVVSDQSVYKHDVTALSRPGNNRRNTFQTPAVQSVPAPIQMPKVRHSIQSSGVVKQSSGFDMQLSSYENISSSLGKSPYDHALNAMSASTSTPESRTKAMTLQLEADARERFARSRRTDGRNETDLRVKHSYESIANRNPHAESRSTSRERSKSRDRSKSRESLAKKPEEAPPMPKALSVEDLNRYYVPRKGKGQPPVSMQTQRNSPVPRKPVQEPAGNQNNAPDRATAKNQSLDPWAAQKDYWANQRQSANEALQQETRGRKSIDGQSRSTPKLNSRKSMDAPRARPRMSLDNKSSNTAKKPVLSHHSSFEQAKQQWRYESGYDYGGQLTLDLEAEYDHTYGNKTPEIRHDEYYEGPTAQENLTFHTPKTGPRPQPIHSHSTSDMLVLDRYAGGLGYGFERGNNGGRHGIVGSAGTKGASTKGSRKSMGISMDYGVDFSDVPVFLTTAPLRS